MIASLPMYDWPELREAHDAFWEILADTLNAAGFEAPQKLSNNVEGEAHWLDANLLLSQTCGYPFSTTLAGKVDLVSTPSYSVEGCNGGLYASAIVINRNSDAATLEDVLASRLAFNSTDSLSGYRCFIPMIGNPSNRFKAIVESGGHRQSAMMVAEEIADCAAIDAVCWDMFQRFEPYHASRLRVLNWGPSFPALPYITRRGWGGDKLAKLALALHQAVASAAQNSVAAALRISSVVPPDEAAYLKLRSLA